MNAWHVQGSVLYYGLIHCIDLCILCETGRYLAKSLSRNLYL